MCIYRCRQVNVLEVITHPDYTLPSDVVGTDEAQWNNNYALLRVAEPIKMNDFIRPVCIPETESEMALVRPTMIFKAFLTPRYWR